MVRVYSVTSMDKEKEFKFLEALYLIQKASDLGNISIGKTPDKGIGPYQKAFEMAKNNEN